MTGEYAGAVSAAETAGGAQPCTQGALRAAEGAREAAGRRGETPGAAAAQADWLAARQYAYLLFQRLFGAEPSGELFSAIDVAVARDAFDIACGAADGEPSFRELLGVLESAAGADAGGLDAWKAEYTRLFVGPAALPAPPWESVYTSHGRLVMQPSTLEVRSAYHKCGFEPALCRRVRTTMWRWSWTSWLRLPRKPWRRASARTPRALATRWRRARSSCRNTWAFGCRSSRTRCAGRGVPRATRPSPARSPPSWPPTRRGLQEPAARYSMDV